MTSTTQKLLDSALALPDNDRLLIAEALIASLHSDDLPPFDDSWREVIQRRSAELTAATVEPVAWSEVKKRARKIADG